MFDMLDAAGVDYARVLDLYAGTGALGIEALSRGDGRCDFVEQDAAACRLIRENLALTGLAHSGAVHRLSVEAAAGRLDGRPYSLVLADPPYADEGALAALDRIAASPLIGEGTVLVLEHSKRQEVPQMLGRLRLQRTRRHGDSCISVYR
jgi:16S rRNA (guanine966-N2)-methyltransferase